MLAPWYSRLLKALRACVRTASSKWCFCASTSPCFVLCTESGELDVIWRATSSAVSNTSDRGTTVFTLDMNKNKTVRKHGKCESDAQSKAVSGLNGTHGVSQEEHLRSELHVTRRFECGEMFGYASYLMTSCLC